jgi:hypothetical protein
MNKGERAGQRDPGKCKAAVRRGGPKGDTNQAALGVLPHLAQSQPGSSRKAKAERFTAGPKVTESEPETRHCCDKFQIKGPLSSSRWGN